MGFALCRPLIPNAARPDLHRYMAGILGNWDSPAVAIGSVADHAHVLFVLSKSHALCKLVEELRKGSSKWAEASGLPADFHWPSGYGAFSVSPSKLDVVRNYVDRQDEHHRTTTLRDEFRTLLVRHEVTFDERYVWD